MSAMQTSLFGDAPETIERLIVVLRLPADAAEAAVEAARESRAAHGLGGKAIEAGRLHVTLIHVGDYANRLPPSVVADMKAVLDGLSASAFDIAFDRAGSFAGAPGKHPHVLLGEAGLDAVRAYRDALWRALTLAGVKMLSRREFNPHVTLMYGDARVPDRPVGPVGWRVGEVELVHSEYGRTNYITLGRWPLG